MIQSGAHLTSPRTLGIVCALSATLLGLLYLRAAGAPMSHLIVNAASLVMGLALLAVISQGAQARAPGVVVLALGGVVLATAMFGTSVEGASRWIRIGGVSLQISLIALPAMLVVFARSGGIPATAGVLLAASGLALQPDRAMAGILAAALAVLLFHKPERQVFLTLCVAGTGFAVALLRPDSLPAVPYVDQILYTSFEVHWLAGIAVVGGALLLAVPALAGYFIDSGNRAVHAVFGVTWFGMVVAAALGNYPTPFVGYGGSAILGYVLSLSYMPIKARLAAAVTAVSPDATRTDRTGNVDLRASVELWPRSTEQFHPRGAQFNPK